MKFKTALLILVTSIAAFGQENFIPARPDNVTESDFRTGEMMLKSAYQQIAEDNYNIVAIDYWNIAVAYNRMGQPREMIYDFIYRSKATNKDDFCEMVRGLIEYKHGVENTNFYKLLGEDFRKLISDCSETETENEFDIDEYIKMNNYDKELIYKLDALLTEDQKWRSVKGDLEKMIETDKVNILKAEEIIKKYGYPGAALAGSKYESVIFLVIQHSDLEYQEKYLPLIAMAVEEKQLSKTPLRMLLDRIYTKKTGLQLFGSQIGVSFSDSKTIEEVKQKYNL